MSRGLIEPVEAYQKSIVKEELIKRMGAIPSLRSPKGLPWTEEELVKAAEGNAQSKKLNAEADAAVIKTVGEAEAARAKILSVGGRKRT